MVGIETMVRAGRSAVKIATQARHTGEARDFYLLQIVQIFSETQPVSCSVDTWVLSRG